MAYGGIAYRYRRYVKPLLFNVHLDNYAGFALLVVANTNAEEILCYSLGCTLAQPVPWVDLLWMSIVWLIWASVWFLLLAPRYAFTEREALLLASGSALLFEFAGSGLILTNPLGLILLAPIPMVAYAATILLPMQLIPLKGTRTTRSKYLAATAAPYAMALPVALLLYLLLPALGVPLR